MSRLYGILKSRAFEILAGVAAFMTALGVKLQSALAAPEIYGFGNTDANSSANTIATTIKGFGQAAVGFIAVSSLIAIIAGGFMYTVSHGNERTVETAKKTIMYAIIGLAVALLAELIVQFAVGKLTPAA
ncbi:hypothetical protein SDD30_15350 [Moorella naiadis]|uniref:hypothetical protein n=1 Tax=Moorella naiadis (nom. illeg.) TaxID=3093670 RepID=UPI003D9CA638